MEKNNNTVLTANMLLDGLRCTKKMYMEKFLSEKVEHIPSIISSEEIQTYKNLARELIAPGGKKFNGNENVHRFLGKKNGVLYDVKLKTADKQIQIDVLQVKNKQVEVYQIFSSVSMIDLHYYEATFILQFLQENGYKINKIFLVCINKDFVLADIITSEFLKIKEVTQPCKTLMPRINKRIDYYKTVLESEVVPEVDIGLYCFKPDKCSCKNACWPDELKTDSIFELRAMRVTKKLGYYYKDIKSIEQIVSKDGHKLPTDVLIQIDSAMKNQIAIHPAKIQEWFSKLGSDNLVFSLDFETIISVLPIAPGDSSFSRIPFQFSVHKFDSREDDFSEQTFLASPKKSIDSRKEFAEALIDAIGNSNIPIIAYNATFERSVIKDLVKKLPEMSSKLKAINSRIFDLMEIFKERWYYDPRFKGSYSLKTIVPVFCPDLSYVDLEISNGIDAGIQYRRLASSNQKESEAIRKALLKYCSMDTYSLLRIFQFLKKLNNNEQT
jgi:hypothetical protein